MSKENAAQVRNQAPARSADSDLESLRAEVGMLRGAIGDLAWLLMDPRLRNKCPCGAIACRTVTATTNVANYDEIGAFLNVQRKEFALCDACQLPEGWVHARSVELAPAFRETVNLVNALRAK